MSGVGRGYAVAQSRGGAQVFGSWLDHDHFQPAARLDSVDSVGADQAGGRRDRPATTSRSPGG